MKNDKITIYMMPWGIKIFGTIFWGFCILFFSLSLLFPIDWQGILALTVFDIFSLYMIFLAFFRRIVFDGEKSVLKLCDFRVRTIPLQNIKVVKRDEDIYSARYGVHCRINIELISGEEKRIGLSVPRGAKQKSWLEHIDQEIADLNKRIDNWYMEYRKQNKKG